ncbi:MAG: hypothetical protein JWM58_3160 [Rhizobium sp.]|nr:hypothetical protein [Rhizobium sp.]
MAVMAAKIIHISIARDWREVYAYASQPENMPIWASGLASGLKADGEDWIADGGPVGEVRVHFTPPNDLGVIDHEVSLQNGVKVQNALRVVPNGDGAEVMFTLLRQSGMDDTAFAADARHVEKDLATLKELLEK